MRTTLTLDPDVEAALREVMHRSGKSFKRAVNDAVRAGLGQTKREVAPFVQPTFSMGRARVDLTKALALASELEDQEQIAKLARDA